MPSSNSTAVSKPGKPYPEFPLFAHASGRWAKKIRGQLKYFGKWADGWEAALARYNKDAAALHAGLTPSDTSGGLTVADLVRKFLAFKKARRDAGHLSPHLFAEYGAVCKRLAARLGKARLVADIGPADFTKIRKRMEAKWGIYRIGSEITRIKTVFKFAHDDGLIPRIPVYGQSFRPPSKKDVRLHRAAVGSRLLSAEDVRRMIAEAGQPLASMILLGLNGAMSNSDLAHLPIDAIDLEGAWLTFARVKTGIPRRVPLWPETVESLREWLKVRPTPKCRADAGLAFITRYGENFKAAEKGSPISQVARKLLDRLGIEGATSFYSLRRCFQNVAEETKDFLAARAIMGHATNDVSEYYREKISDERLRAVVGHVRQWLFAAKTEGNGGGA